MPSFLASKDSSKPTGQQYFIETADPGTLVGIREDLIIADGEKDVSERERGRRGTNSLTSVQSLNTDQWIRLVPLRCSEFALAAPSRGLGCPAER